MNQVAGLPEIEIQASQIGWTAEQWLAAPNSVGSVLAVISHAAYLTTHAGEIFWLASASAPAHARALLMPFEPRLIRAGVRWAVHATRLRVGAVTVNWQSAIEWKPTAIEPDHIASLAVIHARARALRAQIAPRGERGAARAATFQAAARRVRTACRARDLARLARAGRDLIGLGEGLSPSGDDFLGGLLFAVRHLDPAMFHRDAQSVAELMVWARTQTNRISYALFADLARGQGPEPLHNIIAALLSVDSRDAWASVERMLAIGHATGRDVLDGMLTGLLALTD